MSFFSDFRVILRDFGVKLFVPGMANNLAVGIKIIKYVWNSFPESKVSEFQSFSGEIKKELMNPNTSQITRPTKQHTSKKSNQVKTSTAIM